MKKWITLLLFFSMVAGPLHAAEKPARKPVARVNGVTITARQLMGKIRTLLPQSYFHQGISQEKLDALRGKALKQLIEEQLKLQEARRQKLRIAQREIDEELEKVIARYPNRKAFQERLKKTGFTMRDVKNEIHRRKLLEHIYQKEVTDKVHVDEKTARTYYENNKKKFIQPTRLHLKNILLKVAPLANNFEKEAIRKKAEAIVRKIRNHDLSFDAAIRKYSEDPNKDRGGDMGLLHKGRLEPTIEKEILQLKPGEAAGPFETFKGYSIFQLVEILPERLSPFEEIKEKLIRDLTGKFTKDREKQWLESLRNQAEIVVFEPGKNPPAPDRSAQP